MSCTSSKTFKSLIMISTLFIFSLSTACNRGFRDLDVFSSEDPWQGIKVISANSGTILGAGVLINKSTGDLYSVGYATEGLDGNAQISLLYDYYITKYNSSGTKLWTKLFGGTIATAVLGAAMDNDGNIVMTGILYGTYAGVSDSGNVEIFIAKHDPAGNLLWAKSKGDPTAQSAGNAVAVDNNNNIYIAGFTEGALDGNTNTGARDSVLIKYDSDGNWISTRQVGSGNASEGKSVVCDPVTNDVYFAGQVGAAVSFDGETSSGNSDLYIQKYNSTGTKIWTAFREPQTAAMVTGIVKVALDSQKNLAVTGSIFNGFGDTNSFIYKINSTTGVDIWSHQIVNPGIKTIYQAVAVDKNDNIIIGGHVDGGIDGNILEGIVDEIIVKYDSAGNRQWTTQIGGNGSSLASFAVTTNSDSDIFSVGYFDLKIRDVDAFQPKNTYTLKLNSSGVLQ